MKKIYLLTFGVLLALGSAAQQKNTGNTLLWEVSGKGLSKPSYVFGTYHLIGKSFIDTMKVVQTKLSAADAVVGELVMDKDLATKLMPFMTTDTTLDQVLTPEEYAKVNAVIKAKAGAELKYFNKLKPMAVQAFLIAFFSPVKLNNPADAIDGYFQRYAQEQQKAVLGLETVEDQGKILFGPSLRKQANNLVKFISDTTKSIRQCNQLYQAYIKQDQQELLSLFKETDDFSASDLDNLLTKRNNNWLAKLPEMMRTQSLFIAVGAGHLFGDYGILAGLKKQGYQVKPLKTN